ncbi:unnamed protein product, partial [marine sediment metagenome]
HQDGILKKRLTYEIMTPQSVGIPSSKLVLGKHSGRHAFSRRLNELGYKLSSTKLNDVFIRFKQLTDKKKYIFDEDIVVLVEEKIGKVPEMFILDYFQISSGSGAVPTATVRLRINKKAHILQESARGDGPVDAAYKAIDKIVKSEINWSSPPKLIDYSLHSISSGKDAQGEVTVKIKYKGATLTGRGASTDIIEASIKSYLNVLNKIAGTEIGLKKIKEKI